MKSRKIAPPKAGRKPVADKKIVVTIYIRQSLIESLGGMESVKAIATQAVEGHKK